MKNQHFDYMEYVQKNQHCIPKNLNYLAREYPEISWLDAQILYAEAVNFILKKHNVDNIEQIGFGKGYLEAKYEFIQKLDYVSNNM